MRGNACLKMPSKLAERRLLIAWNCAELRLPIAWKCAELRLANAWKCAEPQFAWECELRGRLRTATRVRGTRVGSAREVRLKCGSSAWNRGPTHWWVPYLYGTGTLSVNIGIANVPYFGSGKYTPGHPIILEDVKVEICWPIRMQIPILKMGLQNPGIKLRWLWDPHIYLKWGYPYTTKWSMHKNVPWCIKLFCLCLSCSWELLNLQIRKHCHLILV